MITMPDLRTSLLDLLHELSGTDVKLIIGGGFGIFLKVDHIQKLGTSTLLKKWPEARSTNDIDLFLRPELLIHSTKLKPLSQALKKLGYKAIPGAENYQFVRPVSAENDARGIKIDILTGPQSSFKNTTVKADNRRARPNPSIGLHAHPVDEVPTLEQGLLSVPVNGALTGGVAWTGEVYVPHPFSFLMMKLFAFSDRLEDPTKDFGRYHALDLYTITATITKKEWDESLQFHAEYHKNSYVKDAADLVEKYFSDIDKMGMIRIRESQYYQEALNVQGFISALKELFAPRIKDLSTK
ncbi:MAG: hypothetical protein A2293_04345 [Elusimicrobia bacterium RIFOXYB2_FULL_49_7]|nr:MAG: hypothetical protein A2293_04345 [Elusimicrobia bacterium RIFOXYB2_FULL_49_7]